MLQPRLYNLNLMVALQLKIMVPKPLHGSLHLNKTKAHPADGTHTKGHLMPKLRKDGQLKRVNQHKVNGFLLLNKVAWHPADGMHTKDSSMPKLPKDVHLHRINKFLMLRPMTLEIRDMHQHKANQYTINSQ